ncbi:MAG: DNA adenine methylase [Candidatus Caenarcaniphilales bacterium]|nr:DNA adenine methylase [Candidatus Caenarcaniphilales bacterium]
MVLDINHRSRPIIKWAGGKSGLLTQFQTHFPQNCKRYIEPFIGGGAVFLALKQGIPSLINDSNEEIVNLYKVVRDYPKELIKRLDDLARNYSEEFYYELRQQNPLNEIDRAARTVFLNKTGFNGLYRQNSKGGFNVPFGKRLRCPELYEQVNLFEVSERLIKAEIKNQDFEEILEEAEEGDLIYCDPPYEPLNRTSSFNSYQANGFAQSEQKRLRDGCLKASRRGAQVFISNSTADFILDLYKEFDIKRVSARRAINSKGSQRGEIDEVLVHISNSSTTHIRTTEFHLSLA